MRGLGSIQRGDLPRSAPVFLLRTAFSPVLRQYSGLFASRAPPCACCAEGVLRDRCRYRRLGPFLWGHTRTRGLLVAQSPATYHAACLPHPRHVRLLLVRALSGSPNKDVI